MSNNFPTDRSNLTQGSQIRSSERIRNLSKSDEKDQITNNTANKETKKKEIITKETVVIVKEPQTQENTETPTQNKGKTNTRNIAQSTQEPEANTAKINTQQNTHNPKQKSITMNQKEIQQNIASFIPEFSGEETHLSNALTRFIGTSDSIYETLTNEEKQIFNKIIKFRLTGDAYIRINRREIKDYPTMKNTLNNMYQTTMSLEELENKYTNIQQSYGESIRNYGYRLMEAIEQYKNGYKTKYNIQEIDHTYQNHLNTTSVQSFKRGLNNTILKEKVATFKAKNIDEIIEETEVIEKMLIMSTTTATPTISTNTATQARTHQTQAIQPNTQQPQPIQTRAQPKPTPILCNFCQKPNHTWDVCRTRMANNYQQNNGNRFNNRPQFQNNQFSPRNQFNNQYSPRTQPQRNQQFQQNPQQFQNNRFPQTSQFTTYRQSPQNTQNNSYQPKYCSHCKTTTSHTFDECRSKFFAPRNNTTNYQKPQQQSPPDGNNLENKFNNMRIQPIFPYDEEPTQQPQNMFQNQENSNGSDQA